MQREIDADGLPEIAVLIIHAFDQDIALRILRVNKLKIPNRLGTMQRAADEPDPPQLRTLEADPGQLHPGQLQGQTSSAYIIQRCLCVLNQEAQRYGTADIESDVPMVRGGLPRPSKVMLADTNNS
jgi:hypothetical protein